MLPIYVSDMMSFLSFFDVVCLSFLFEGLLLLYIIYMCKAFLPSGLSKVLFWGKMFVVCLVLGDCGFRHQESMQFQVFCSNCSKKIHQDQ